MDFTSNIDRTGKPRENPIRAGTIRDAASGDMAIPALDSQGKSGRIATLLEAATQPFLGLDRSGRINGMNRAMADLVGRSIADLMGVPLTELTSPSSRSSVTRALDQVAETRKALLFEIAMVRSDGREVPVEVAMEPDQGGDSGRAGYFAFVHDLTEHKLVEHALRESEERFRRLYDDAPVGYHEVDVEGRILSVNKTECEMLGYAQEELIGRPVFEVIAAESREEARRAFPEKVAGRLPLKPFERTIMTRDGRALILAIEERHKHDLQGNVTGLLTTVRDVTDRKRAEAALLISERRARALFEGMDEAVFVHDAQGRILDANPAATRLLGYRRDELLAMTTRQIDAPDFAAGYAGRLEEQLTTGHLSCEGRHRTRDGRILPVEINSSTIQFDGQTAVLAVIRDISERRALDDARQALAITQAENARAIAEKNAALTLSEARYRQLTEGCLDGVVAADRSGIITLFNPAAERIFGYQAFEVEGQPLSLLMPEAFAGFQERDAGRSPLVGRTVEVLGRRKGGDDFPIEISLNEVQVAGQTQYVASLRDQTERQRMRAVLAQSEKLASIGLLSAGVAHEINNPLAYVGNNLAVLERELAGVRELIEAYEGLRAFAEPDSLRRIDDLIEEMDWPYTRENLPRMLARTREGVQRVANIVSNLRGLARTAPPKMEEVAVGDLIEGALEMLRDRLRRHHIEVRIDLVGTPRLVCVATQISQVILNLLINATQAVESTGRAEGGVIHVTAVEEGSTLTLSVHDDGVGIPLEDLPRLFDPFFTTKSVGEGTGLGLAICHGIVTGHGGRIDVQSSPGSGTSFRVYLPTKNT
ncbi:MAG: PAS domain S-box protein [Isosphaeraceae bacterium]